MNVWHSSDYMVGQQLKLSGALFKGVVGDSYIFRVKFFDGSVGDIHIPERVSALIVAEGAEENVKIEVTFHMRSSYIKVTESLTKTSKQIKELAEEGSWPWYKHVYKIVGDQKSFFDR